MADEVRVSARIDAYQPIHLDFPDPKVLALVASIDFEIRRLQQLAIGPYGAIEGIIGALEDFAEDWNA